MRCRDSWNNSTHLCFGTLHVHFTPPRGRQDGPNLWVIKRFTSRLLQKRRRQVLPRIAVTLNLWIPTSLARVDRLQSSQVSRGWILRQAMIQHPLNRSRSPLVVCDSRRDGFV